MAWTPPYEPPGDAEYESYFEGPDVLLYRRQWEAEQRALKVVNRLLDSLKPADAEQGLFTFAQIREWGLKHTRKRSA